MPPNSFEGGMVGAVGIGSLAIYALAATLGVDPDDLMDLMELF